MLKTFVKAGLLSATLFMILPAYAATPGDDRSYLPPKAIEHGQQPQSSKTVRQQSPRKVAGVRHRRVRVAHNRYRDERHYRRYAYNEPFFFGLGAIFDIFR